MGVIGMNLCWTEGKSRSVVAIYSNFLAFRLDVKPFYAIRSLVDKRQTMILILGRMKMTYMTFVMWMKCLPRSLFLAISGQTLNFTSNLVLPKRPSLTKSNWS